MDKKCFWKYKFVLTEENRYVFSIKKFTNDYQQLYIENCTGIYNTIYKYRHTWMAWHFLWIFTTNFHRDRRSKIRIEQYSDILPIAPLFSLIICRNQYQSKVHCLILLCRYRIHRPSDSWFNVAAMLQLQVKNNIDWGYQRNSLSVFSYLNVLVHFPQQSLVPK